MKARYLLLGIFLGMQPTVWAADAPSTATPTVEVTPPSNTPTAESTPTSASATPAAPIVATPDVEEEVEELPTGFAEAQPVPIPEKTIKPAELKTVVAKIEPYQIEVGGSYAKLSNGARDGNAYIAAEMKLESRNNIYASIRRENRFAYLDNEMMGGFYQPIDEQFSLVTEISVSPTHYAMPSRTILGQVEFLRTKGWGGSVGLRHAEYSDALMNVLSLTVERSWGNYRAAFSHFQGFWANHGSTSSGQIQFAKYYGDYNWYGLIYSDGSELDTLPSLIKTSVPVRALIVNGRHWVKADMALTYAVSNFRHGDIYTRNGIQLGLRYQF